QMQHERAPVCVPIRLQFLQRFLDTLAHGSSPHRFAAPADPACWRMWQFLYFLPEPHGHGSLRPTRSDVLRIGSGFLSDWAPFVETPSPFTGAATARGAASWIATPTVSWKPSSSSMRHTASVMRSCTPTHIWSNSCMPSRL